MDGVFPPTVSLSHTDLIHPPVRLLESVRMTMPDRSLSPDPFHPVVSLYLLSPPYSPSSSCPNVTLASLEASHSFEVRIKQRTGVDLATPTPSANHGANIGSRLHIPFSRSIQFCSLETRGAILTLFLNGALEAKKTSHDLLPSQTPAVTVGIEQLT